MLLIFATAAIFNSSPTQIKNVIDRQTFATTLHIAGRLNASFAGELFAKNDGIFQRKKLNLQIVPHSELKGQDLISAVIQEPGSIGVIGALVFLKARLAGRPIVSFAGHYLESPVAFYTLEKSGIRSPSQFEGKRVGSRPSEEAAFVYEYLMAKMRVSRSKVTEVPGAAFYSSLLNGEIDIFPGDVETGASLRKLGIQYSSVRPFDFGVHVLGSVYFASEETISRQPEMIRRFLEGVIEGWRGLNSNYKNAVLKLKDIGATDEELRFILEQQRNYLQPPGERFGEFDSFRWRVTQDLLLQQRRLERSSDLTKAVTYDFLREAYRRDSP
jgi:ABC-type nitrate/sulfonate/bicarbonate transport system substrate-binding protein